VVSLTLAMTARPAPREPDITAKTLELLWSSEDTDARGEGRGRRAVIPRGRSARRAGMLAPAGRLFEAFEGALSGRVSKRQGDVAPSSDAELRSKDVRVSLGCSRGDSKTLGDLDVRAPLCDELNHLPLAGSELLLLGHGKAMLAARDSFAYCPPGLSFASTPFDLRRKKSGRER
jgi:hypothetical protein